MVRENELDSAVVPKSYDVDVDHIVSGAGVSGVVAAKELKDKGKSFVILEKTEEVGGMG